MSHVAIAAALALSDVSAGERMAAFSLASFANREHRAWPGTRVAAARAGLSRSQYLAARDGLVRRGLVVVEHAGDGRGNSPVVAVTFAQAGPWVDGEINAPLFEAALSWSRDAGVCAAAAGRVGGARRRAAGGEPPVDRGAARGRGDGRQHVPPSEGGVAGERRGRARGRRRRSREDEPMGASRPALGQPRAGAGAARTGRAEQLGEAAARHRHRAGRGRSQRAGGRAGGGRKRSGIERYIGCKPRREPDRFGWEQSGIERGIGEKPRSMSDCFAANPAGNPATNPAALRARGKGTPEPSNLSPPTPRWGEQR